VCMWCYVRVCVHACALMRVGAYARGCYVCARASNTGKFDSCPGPFEPDPRKEPVDAGVTSARSKHTRRVTKWGQLTHAFDGRTHATNASLHLDQSLWIVGPGLGLVIAGVIWGKTTS
jgi:hypothetical protein